MTKMEKNTNLNNICESCAHVLKEKKIDINNRNLAFSDAEINQNLCKICGGPLFSEFDGDNKDINLLVSALNNPSLKVIFFIAPSVRVALGDSFNVVPGTNVCGKLITSLKALGAFRVFDMKIPW